MANICPKCGAEYEDMYAFCIACGARLPHDIAATMMRQPIQGIAPNIRRVEPLIDPSTLGASEQHASMTEVFKPVEGVASASGATIPGTSIRVQPLHGGSSHPLPNPPEVEPTLTTVFGKEPSEFDEQSAQNERQFESLSVPQLRPVGGGVSVLSNVDEIVPTSWQEDTPEEVMPAHVVPPIQPSRQVRPHYPEYIRTYGGFRENNPMSQKSVSELIGDEFDASSEDYPDSPTLIYGEPMLIQLRRRNDGYVYEFVPPVMVGKGTKADVMISGNRYIGREHARITVDEHNLFITDNASSNGTYVNDTRIDSGVPVRINDGDVIRLANEEFEVMFILDGPRKGC